MVRTVMVMTAALLGAGACGKKKNDVDCARYAEHLADVNTEGLVGSDRDRPRQTVLFSAEQACRSGRVPTAEVTCVMAATTAAQTRACAGLPPIESSPPATTTRVHGKGFSIAIAPGWKLEKASSQREGELLVREDKPDTDTHVSGGVYISRGPAKVATNEDECATKGRNMEHPPAKLRSTRWGPTALGQTCHLELTDDRMVILGDSIGVGSGEAVVFNCYYDLHDAGPPPACAEMFASIKLEE